MTLLYPNDWRFSEGIFPVPDEAVTAVERLVEEIVASAPNPKAVYETVKHRYGNTTISSDVSWAETDMGKALRRSMGNAPAFVDKFWMALEDDPFQGEGEDRLLVGLARKHLEREKQPRTGHRRAGQGRWPANPYRKE
uniref:hypothetical protein n=1 Tax=Archangium sp. TaxID=1872627 RepID=UPI00286A8415